MNKRAWHHYLRPLRSISIKSMFILVLVIWLIAAISLRANNIRALELRDNVFAADESGEGIEESLQMLREYVHSHMNTSLSTGTSVYPPIQLKHTYDRLVSAEQKRVAAINEKIYVNAQDYCEKQNSADFSGRNRVPCIEKYVSDRGQKEKSIPDALYKFDFASPTWSPDFAGWSLLAALGLSLALCVRLAVELWAKTKHI